MKLGSHVGMSGKEMMLGSVAEALSYEGDTFMLYTGAPQNSKRKEISLLRIPEARRLMEEHHMKEFIVHAPYMINLANGANPDIFSFSVEFLQSEMERTGQMGSSVLVLHPGAHVGVGRKQGIKKICEGLNEALSGCPSVLIALETMAGKGTEIGGSFEDLAEILEGVKYPDRIKICFDTCHTHDAGYSVRDDFGKVMEQFQRRLGMDKLQVIHLNDSKNPAGSRKDRHANLGQGYIGFEALRKIALWPGLEDIPKILETPYIPFPGEAKKSVAPYRAEIEMLRTGNFFSIQAQEEERILAKRRAALENI